MTVFNCGDEISKYHKNKVTLREPQQNDMRERRNNGRERLNKGLDEAGHPRPRVIHSQGSYRMWTMIQDSDCDYDIDDGVYFRLDDLKDTGGENLMPLRARCRICDALTRDQRFANPAEVHDNCVRQEYQEGYHIDMPVYRIQTENPGTESEREVYELASKNTWELSDARSVTKWFNDKVSELNSESDDNGHQLRRVVRLTKAFARSRNEWKDRTTSGITMSRLIVDEFCAVASRDDETLLQAWKKIDARLKTSTEVEHPINPALLAEDGNENVRFFQEKLAEALETLTVLEQNCTRNEAREAWDSVFNTDYFSNLPDPSDPSDGTKAVFIATESKTDTRDDGNGRYGRGSKT